MANVLKRTGLMYKSKLAKKCTDLQMVEPEVDLLGDEVDALLRSLEKIYVALDHYSPVLKHYPGDEYKVLWRHFLSISCLWRNVFGESAYCVQGYRFEQFVAVDQTHGL